MTEEVHSHYDWNKDEQRYEDGCKDGAEMSHMEHDPVNHPTHYASEAKCSGCGEPIEAIDVIRHLGFNIGNSIKYLWRAGKKDDIVQDLKKAIWYIQDQISMIEGTKNPNVHRLAEKRTDQLYADATAAIGKVTDVQETEKGLEVKYELYCDFGKPPNHFWSSDGYTYTCLTHGRNVTVKVEGTPEKCPEGGEADGSADSS